MQYPKSENANGYGSKQGENTAGWRFKFERVKHEGIGITPDGSTAYVANTGGDTVSVINLATNTVAGTPINVGHLPPTIAIAGLPPPTLPPRKCVGKIIRNAHSYKNSTVQMKWKKSLSSTVDHYEILAHGKVIASIPASTRTKFAKRLFSPYLCHKRLPGKYYRYLERKYSIQAVTLNGVPSSPQQVKIVH